MLWCHLVSYSKFSIVKFQNESNKDNSNNSKIIFHTIGHNMNGVTAMDENGEGVKSPIKRLGSTRKLMLFNSKYTQFNFWIFLQNPSAFFFYLIIFNESVLQDILIIFMVQPPKILYDELIFGGTWSNEQNDVWYKIWWQYTIAFKNKIYMYYNTPQRKKNK